MTTRSKKAFVTIVVFVLIVVAILLPSNMKYLRTDVMKSNRPLSSDMSRLWRTFTATNTENETDIHQGDPLLGEIHVEDSGDENPLNGLTAMRIDNASDAGAGTARSCQKQNNIAFFKMHKCGSSTMQNILMRFGDRYNLNFVLPVSGNYLGSNYFRKQFAMTFPVKEYNILCHHTRFSKEGFDSVMPPKTVFVTIIRDPATMFESTFTYLKYPARYGISGTDALRTFLVNPNKYYLPNRGKDHAKDSMLYDLGLENELKTVPAEVDKKIERIASEFDLVMLTEYFSESLILLKELMCWDFKDITSFKMNARSKTSVKEVSESLGQKIREWNDGDMKLYTHFNRTFWEKVEAFGTERMQKEVAKLEQANEMLKERCIEKVVVNDNNVWHPPGIAVESFKVKSSAANDKDCQLMAKTELPFTNYIRQNQIAKYFGKKAHAL